MWSPRRPPASKWSHWSRRAAPSQLSPRCPCRRRRSREAKSHFHLRSRIEAFLLLDIITCSLPAHRSTPRQLSCLFLRLEDERRSGTVSTTELHVAVSCSCGGWGGDVSCRLRIDSAVWVITFDWKNISVFSCGARVRFDDHVGDFLANSSGSIDRLSGSGFSVISSNLDLSPDEGCGSEIEQLTLISEYSGTESRHAAVIAIAALHFWGRPENLSRVESCEDFALEELKCKVDFFWVSHKFSIFCSESSCWGSELKSFERRLHCDGELLIRRDKLGLLEAEDELWNRRPSLCAYRGCAQVWMKSSSRE